MASSAIGEVSMKKSKASHEVGALSGVAGKVSIEKGKAIPSLASEAASVGIPSLSKAYNMSSHSCGGG